MKKLAVVITMLGVMMLAGCLRPAVNMSVPPLAYIDSVSSSRIYAGDKIKFAGHGVPSVGEIVTFSWRSSVNGPLSQLATFETNTLTAGSHTIWFKVQDSFGNWSKEVGTNVTVQVQGAPTTMTINIFSATPPSIKEGDWASLSWDVAGLGAVYIDNGIGDVASSGSRSVQPLKTTIYTLIAKNDEGLVKASTQVAVSPVPLYSFTTYSVPAEEGTIRGNDVTFGEVLVGEDQGQNTMQGFVSFDITALPREADIKSVQLDLTRAKIYNSPFPFQGSLQILNQQYGLRYDQDRNLVNLSMLPLFSWSPGIATQQFPPVPFVSPDFVKALQGELDTGGKRLQFKLQFEKYYYYPFPNFGDKKYQFNSKDANYIDVGSGNPGLVVLFALPEGTPCPPGCQLLPANQGNRSY